MVSSSVFNLRNLQFVVVISFSLWWKEVTSISCKFLFCFTWTRFGKFLYFEIKDVTIVCGKFLYFSLKKLQFLVVISFSFYGKKLPVSVVTSFCLTWNRCGKFLYFQIKEVTLTFGKFLFTNLKKLPTLMVSSSLFKLRKLQVCDGKLHCSGGLWWWAGLLQN